MHFLPGTNFFREENEQSHRFVMQIIKFREVSIDLTTLYESNDLLLSFTHENILK